MIVTVKLITDIWLASSCLIVKMITDIWLASSCLIVKILSISEEKIVFHVHRSKKELFEAGVLQLLGSIACM